MTTFEYKTEEILKKIKSETRHQLAERIKELSGMYGVLKLGLDSEDIDSYLANVVNLLPSSWQYPEATRVRISHGGHIYASKNFKSSPWVQSADLEFSGKKLGSIEVFYTQEEPRAHEGSFLKEERKLLEGVSAVISVIIQQKLDEKKLRADEGRYRLFIKNFKGINFQGDMNFNFEFLTGAVEDITGYKPDEFLEGKVNWLDLVYKYDRDLVLKSSAKIRKVPNYSREREYRLIKKNGQKLWVKEIIQNIVGSDGNPEYVKGIIIDISRQKNYEQRIEHLNSLLMVIRNINQLIVSEKDADRLIEGTCRDLVKTRGYKIAWILLFDRNHGFKRGFCTGIDRQFDQFLAQVAEGNLPFCLKKMLSRPEIMVIDKLQKECAGCSLIKENQYKQIIAPISSKHRFYGVLSISLEKTIYGKKELVLLKEISDDLFLGLNNIYLEQERDKAIKDLEISYRHTKEALDGTIKALSSIVEYKDPYTHSHQIRVAILAKKIARQMGLPGHEIEAIGIGSLVHDIGKISIPASILSKPGKLSEIEKKMIRVHPQTSYQMIEKIKFEDPVKKYVLQHHERLDGSGYPQGLKAKQISLGAKIIAVADVVEAISSHRPYRAALGEEEALREIEKYKGKLYDLAAAVACLKIFEQHEQPQQIWKEKTG